MHAAAETISGLLNPEPATANQEEQTDVAPELQTDTVTETTETTPETLAPETPPSEPESPTLYDVTYGDEVKKLTIDELISGNMMERDYRYKTGKFGERERTIAANEAKLSQNLTDLDAALQQDATDLGSAAMLELKEADPNSYWEAFEKVKIRADTLNKAKADRAESDKHKAQTNLVRENELMVQAIPTWLDSNVMQKEFTELGVYLSSRGQDISTITNHKEVVNARKAMLYDRIMSQDIETNRDRTPPKSTSPTPSAIQEVTTAETQRLETLKKTGRRQDAQAVINDILKRGPIS